jgi:hypothetical protein
MNEKNDTSYDINFFKPQTNIARDNNRVIILFVSIWAIAVFGFQFLLMATNKLTPEDSLLSYRSIWEKVESGEVTAEENQELAKVLLTFLGKNIALNEADKTVLKNALGQTLKAIAPDQPLTPEIAAEVLVLKPSGFDQLMIELLPYSLPEEASAGYGANLPEIMEKYGNHPRGPLTDFNFLGFPFHYWYTAQFLLILFVLLCLAYAHKIEKIYKKHDFVEEHD